MGGVIATVYVSIYPPVDGSARAPKNTSDAERKSSNCICPNSPPVDSTACAPETASEAERKTPTV